MTAFFVRTDIGASGPFTGIELREAALAGLLTPETVISSSPSGPWTPAYEAGLFSEKRVPLPHPRAVNVPSYQVNGLSRSFRGPFKLRELIGFAARGLLPPDAMLRAEMQEFWIPVTRINILAATLKGDLALIDSSGKVIRRTALRASVAEQSDARAPVDIAKPSSHFSMDAVSDSLVASDLTRDPVTLDKKSATIVIEVSSNSPARTQKTAVHVRHSRFHFPEFRLNRTFVRRAGITFILVMIVATAGYAVTHRRPTTIAREIAYGDWLIPNDDDSTCLCGLAFRPDGRVVVFNVESPCWTGRYRWLPRTDDTRGLRGVDTTIELDTASMNHPIEPVGATDGYLKFISEGDSLPIIDGHSVGDVFVQRIGDQLRLGYLVSIDVTADRKQLNAAWIVFDRALSQSGARDANRIEIDQLPEPAKLLVIHGIPDEARPIQRHEVPREKITERYAGAQFIRYSNRQFALTHTESWQPVAAIGSPKPSH